MSGRAHANYPQSGYINFIEQLRLHTYKADIYETNLWKLTNHQRNDIIHQSFMYFKFNDLTINYINVCLENISFCFKLCHLCLPFIYDSEGVQYRLWSAHDDLSLEELLCMAFINRYCSQTQCFLFVLFCFVFVCIVLLFVLFCFVSFFLELALLCQS